MFGGHDVTVSEGACRAVLLLWRAGRGRAISETAAQDGLVLLDFSIAW